MSKLRSALILLVLMMLIHQSCGIYSFTGTSLSPDVKTITIRQFFNNAPLGPATMSQLFTERMKDYFQQNTSLTLVDDDGDLEFEGSIENFTVTPQAPAASGDDLGVDFAALTRVTITVKCSYENRTDDEFNFDQSFSFYEDFDNEAQDLQAIEDELVDRIFEQIVLDIFNASVANW